jgi:hypothetical protein
LKTLWMVRDMAPNRGVSSTHSGTLANGSEHLGAMGRVPSGLDPSTEHHRATESVRASNGVKGPPPAEGAGSLQCLSFTVSPVCW